MFAKKKAHTPPPHPPLYPAYLQEQWLHALAASLSHGQRMAHQESVTGGEQLIYTITVCVVTMLDSGGKRPLPDLLALESFASSMTQLC